MTRHVNTWFITGASSGLGLAFAEKALEEGDQVVLAARSRQAMKAVVACFPDMALAIEMDITDRPQRTTAVRGAEAHFGRIDVLVNNAGVDFLGAIDGESVTWR